MSRAEDLAATLAGWRPVDAAQAVLRDDYLAFLDAQGAGSLDRDAGPEHVTGSCFVLTPDLRHVLLCFHRKGQFWVQVGGHVEPEDADVAHGAFREAQEESGLAVTPWSALPVDVHRHELAGAFGHCRAHRDVGFAAIADPDAVPQASDESDDVAWFGVDDLPEHAAPDLPERLETVLREMRARLV